MITFCVCASSAPRRRRRVGLLALAACAAVFGCGRAEFARDAQETGPAGDEFRLPDVFLIVLDTARRDAFGLFESASPIGGELADLARDGIVLDDLRAPSSWTRASVATLLTGLQPDEHQVHGRLDVLSPSLVTLPIYLRAHGYRTLGWTTNPNVLSVWGFGRGFDALHDVGARAQMNVEHDADSVFERVLTEVKPDHAAPTLYYIHLMDPHEPYEPPKRNLQRVRRMIPAPTLPGSSANDALGKLRYHRYLAEIDRADQALGRFLRELEDRSVYERSLVLLVSDHGEEFFDHGGLDHARTLYEEMLRVPGVLKLPGNERAGSRIARTVELRDMLSTVCRAIGLDPPEGLPDRNLLVEQASEAPQIAHLILDEHRMSAIRDQEWKLIVDHRSGDRELYNLREDPAEHRDRSAENPAKVRELAELLEHLGGWHEPGWHVLACGCREASTLRIELRGVGSRPFEIDLEAEDSVAFGAHAVSADFHLTPRIARNDRRGIVIRRSVPDRDELVIASGTAASSLEAGGDGGAGHALALRAAASGPWAVAIGNGTPASAEGWLLFEDVEGALLGASQPVDCSPPLPAPWKPQPETRECTSHVRIWRVAEPTALTETDVDPLVIERLRALGYWQ